MYYGILLEVLFKLLELLVLLLFSLLLLLLLLNVLGLVPYDLLILLFKCGLTFPELFIESYFDWPI